MSEPTTTSEPAAVADSPIVAQARERMSAIRARIERLERDNADLTVALQASEVEVRRLRADLAAIVEVEHLGDWTVADLLAAPTSHAARAASMHGH